MMYGSWSLLKASVCLVGLFGWLLPEKFRATGLTEWLDEAIVNMYLYTIFLPGFWYTGKY